MILKSELYGKLNLIAVAFSVNLLMILSGCLVNWTSVILSRLNTINDENPFGMVITVENQSLLVSIYSFGAIFGTILSGIFANKMERKNSLIYISGLLFLVALLSIIFTKSFPLYCIARFIGGVAFGNAFPIVPLYLSEISEVNIRGAVASSLNISIVFGQFLIYTIGPFVSTKTLNIFCLSIIILFLFTFPFCPESPYFYVAKNDLKAAERSLFKLRKSSKEKICEELDLIKIIVEEEWKSKKTILDLIGNRKCLRALTICLGLITFQQMSGISAIIYYTSDIFKESGSSIDFDISALIFGSVQLMGSFITPLLVDRMGRKNLMELSCAGIITSELFLGLYFYLKNMETTYDLTHFGWLPLLCLITFIILFNIGLGPVPWIILGEVFPADVKTFASTIIACYFCLLSFIFSYVFKFMLSALTAAGTFWFFASFTFLATIFISFCIIETKGKTFLEIQKML